MLKIKNTNSSDWSIYNTNCWQFFDAPPSPTFNARVKVRKLNMSTLLQRPTVYTFNVNKNKMTWFWKQTHEMSRFNLGLGPGNREKCQILSNKGWPKEQAHTITCLLAFSKGKRSLSQAGWDLHRETHTPPPNTGPKTIRCSAIETYCPTERCNRRRHFVLLLH